jgi:poly-gamma-glutamate capsule biosynthesis protein CapA/YwtB (metallophosphatase superfamily)
MWRRPPLLRSSTSAALACATGSSGVPSAWAAGRAGAGINLLPDLSDRTVDFIAAQLNSVRRPKDIVIVSIHWGPNWGYDVSRDESRFARALIDRAGISIVHGHSAHHPKAVEVYRSRLILYGCGDLLNDYEGIRGHAEFRSDLALMFFATVERSTGNLAGLEMTPFQIRRFQLVRAVHRDAEWLAITLDRESKKFGTGVALTAENRLVLKMRRMP